MSLRKAINAMCKACLYDESPGSGGTWRQQVGACTSPKCPLFSVRPLPSGVARGNPLKLILARENGQNGVILDNQEEVAA